MCVLERTTMYVSSTSKIPAIQLTSVKLCPKHLALWAHFACPNYYTPRRGHLFARDKTAMSFIYTYSHIYMEAWLVSWISDVL